MSVDKKELDEEEKETIKLIREKIEKEDVYIQMLESAIQLNNEISKKYIEEINLTQAELNFINDFQSYVRVFDEIYEELQSGVNLKGVIH